MADNFNQQYSSPLYGIGGNWATTSFPGSPGVQDEPPGVGGGGVIASPVVSAPYGSSQLAVNMPTIPVTAGDTSSFSDDQPIHASALLPGSGDGAGSAAITGIGYGKSLVES